MTYFFYALLIGSASGALAAFCGVGGGIVMGPAVVFALGLDQKQAVATSLAVIIPTAMVATVKYSNENLVDWRIAAFTALGAIVVTCLVADRLKGMDEQLLKRIFATVMIVIGLKMW